MYRAQQTCEIPSGKPTHAMGSEREGSKRRAPRIFEDIWPKCPNFDERYDATLLKSSTNFDVDKFKEIYSEIIKLSEVQLRKQQKKSKQSHIRDPQ